MNSICKGQVTFSYYGVRVLSINFTNTNSFLSYTSLGTLIFWWSIKHSPEVKNHFIFLKVLLTALQYRDSPKIESKLALIMVLTFLNKFFFMNSSSLRKLFETWQDGWAYRARSFKGPVLRIQFALLRLSCISISLLPNIWLELGFLADLGTSHRWALGPILILLYIWIINKFQQLFLMAVLIYLK